MFNFESRNSFAFPILITVVVCTLCTALFASSFYWTSKVGYTYHYQNTWTESEKIFDSPGVHFKLPGFSIVTPYKQVFTIDRTGDKESTASFVGPMMKVAFADTYLAEIPGNFRFRLPTNHDSIKRIHREFRSFDNLIKTLIEKTSVDVANTTANQFTGEEFFLGAMGQYKAAINDQLINGIYKTERSQVEVSETGLAQVGLGQENSNKLKKTQKLIWKTVPVKDKKTKKIVRLTNPLAAYGITSAPFTMGRPIPEPQLDKLLIDKKKLVADRIRFVQAQETSKEEAKTEQLKKQIERTRETQEALKKKELAVIAAQQEVDLAGKQAEKETVEQEKLKSLAVIQKDKEREIAIANLDIQKANYESAKYEAKAIKEKGLAEAAVISAKYKAYDTAIYMAELKSDVDKTMYQNLRSFDVTMPSILNMGASEGGLPTNLKTLTDLSLFNTFDTAHQISK